MRKPMEILEPGAKVIVGEDIEGRVLEVNLASGRSVSYKVAWWNGRARSTDWLDASEVRVPDQPATVKIGFHIQEVTP